MAYSKLTSFVIDALVSELRETTRASSVRCICAKAGISHTTFYRWLRGMVR